MMSGIGFVFSDTGFMSNLSWFVLLYILGAYIRLYDIERVSSKSIKIFSVIGYVAFMIIACGITFMSQYNSSIFRILNKISSMNSIIVLIESVLIFCAFKNLEIKNNKVINVLGKSSIGVYLLHDSIFRVDFWKKICLVERFYFANPLIFVAHIAVCVGGIYVCGVILEWIRRKVVEEWFFKSKRVEK